MIDFIKFSSLMIILLFFSILSYFISINCNLEENTQVDLTINIYPEGYGNSTRWYAYVYIFLRSNNESFVIEDID